MHFPIEIKSFFNFTSGKEEGQIMYKSIGSKGQLWKPGF